MGVVTIVVLSCIQLSYRFLVQHSPFYKDPFREDSLLNCYCWAGCLIF